MNNPIKTLNKIKLLNYILNKGNLNFNPKMAFHGKIFNFNIWDFAMDNKNGSILGLYHDCTLSACGNVAQWSDFWAGTRGDVKVVWPTTLALRGVKNIFLRNDK